MPKLSITTIRKAAELVIQRNPAMKLQCRKLNNHSPKVGEDHYDDSGKSARVEWVRLMENLESPSSSQKFETDKKREDRKKEKEKQDEASRKENATKYLKLLDDRKKKNLGLNLRCKVKPLDRPYLMKVVFENIFESKVQQFPKGNYFNIERKPAI